MQEQAPSSIDQYISVNRVMTTAERYALFAQEARDSSPLYVTLATGVSRDDEILELLQRVPPRKRQPNLLFASVLYLGGVQADYRAFRSFVLEHQDELLELLTTRSTQTNEVGRCATLLPVLARLPGPLALLEVGASAGLCLLPDRYSYQYDGGELIGDPSSPVRLACRTTGPVPVPRDGPEIAWRRGIDLHPIDVCDEEATRWLESCVWPDQPERLARLRAAIQVARRDPPEIIADDLVERIVDVAETAPPDATLVVFHSAVLAYLPRERRKEFAELVHGRPWVWISNEAPGVIESLQGEYEERDVMYFLLGVGGSELVAVTDPHGRWMEWLG